ncbi:MAG TPA: hypothetical protein PLY87_02865 [Planctomycetaceae bacterium]|nr:hypothetical protein [Planctomycetaceae bacterium]
MSGQAVPVNEPVVSRASDAVVSEVPKSPGVEVLRPSVYVVEPVSKAVPVPEPERADPDTGSMLPIEVAPVSLTPRQNGLIAVQTSEPKPDPVIMRVD